MELPHFLVDRCRGLDYCRVGVWRSVEKLFEEINYSLKDISYICKFNEPFY
jgi:hypothetical protein